MGAFFCLTLLVLCGVVWAIDYNDTQALLFDGDKATGEFLRLLHAEDEFVLIGCRHYLYNISTNSMLVNQRIEWMATDVDIRYCYNEIVKFNSDCNVYVRSAIKKSDSHYVICASSAKTARCRNYKLVEGVWVLQDGQVTTIGHVMLAPLFPWHEIRKLVTSVTKTLYIAGHNLRSTAVWCPQLYRGNSYDVDGKFVFGLRSECTGELFKVDFQSERPSVYSGIFETKDYVYLTFSEPALETFHSIGSEPTTYSRIARVCKNDRGRGTNITWDQDSKYKWATLFKSRLICGNAGVTRSSANYMKGRFNGYYSTSVNEIVDSSTTHLSSVTGADGEEVIIAIFNSPRNGIQTSAICAYKVSDINKIFDNSAQVEFAKDMTPQIARPTRPAARCYNDSRLMGQESKKSVGHYLLYDSVRPVNNYSLFMGNVDYRMTRMAVDWQVEALDGKKYDVIFVSTDNGRLIKLVNMAAPGALSKYEVIEERDIFPGQHIHEMKLIHFEDGKKHLLINTLEKVKRVAIEKCHFYSDCAACIELRDPYCSWSPSLSKCVSTTHAVHDKHQSLTNGTSPVCKVDNGGSTGTPNSVATTEPTADGVDPSVGNKGIVGASKQTEGGSSNLVYIVLMVLLPIIFGAIGAFVGYMYSKRRHTSQTPHIDQELTNKCKEDGLNSNCDAYQAFPKQSNLQLMNNLNGKSPNVDTASMGERTLTRQKQVYV